MFMHQKYFFYSYSRNKAVDLYGIFRHIMKAAALRLFTIRTGPDVDYDCKLIDLGYGWMILYMFSK